MDDALKSRLGEAHRRLLEEIRREAEETARYTGRSRFSEAVMTALAKVPRHLFVDAEDAPYAYVNRPREIGCGQTISQPYIVALMSDLLDLQPGDRVLEVGTGSGYQAAVLAELGAEVYTVEAYRSLAEKSRKRLQEAGYEAVHARQGDGFKGWPEAAPFDAIIVTAAPERLPEELAGQLRPGGRMVVPVGRAWESQVLRRCVRTEDGRLDCEDVLPVAFVPMVPGQRDR